VKHGAYWFWDWLAGQLLAASLTIFFFSLGIGYMVDDEVVVQATVTAAKQADKGGLGEGYHALWKAVDDAKTRALEPFPEAWHEPLKQWHRSAALGILLAGLALLFWRAPTRAHALQEMGWGIAAPGVLTAFATLILEWQAMKGLRATVMGDRSARTLLSEGREAAVDAFHALWPALLAGALLLAAGIALERRWRRKRRDGRGTLAFAHVSSHFLIVGGAIPWLHFVVAVALGAATKGSSVGASTAPFVSSPVIYGACVGIFSLGASLWVLARAEVKRIEASER
jgi:hypothetical protein